MKTKRECDDMSAYQAESMDTDVRPRIVMMDDEPFFMKAVSRILEGAGLEVHTCSDWPQLPGILRRVKPGVLLLDYNMPMLSGGQICEILKRNSIDPDTRIVFFSSESTELIQGVMSRCQAAGFIPKQTPPTELAQKVKGYLL